MLTGIIAAVCGAMFVVALVVTLCVFRSLFREAAACKKAIRAEGDMTDKVLRVAQEKGNITVVCRELLDKRSVPQSGTWRRGE